MLTGLSVFVALMWLESGAFLEATSNLQRRSFEMGCKNFNYDCCMFEDISVRRGNGNSKQLSIIRKHCPHTLNNLCCPEMYTALSKTKRTFGIIQCITAIITHSGVREACCSIPIMSFLFDCDGESGEPHHPPGEGGRPAPPPTEYPFPTPPPEDDPPPPPPPPPQNRPPPPPGNEPPPPPPPNGPNGPGGSGNPTQPGENPQTSKKPEAGPKITLLPPKIPVQPPPDDVDDEPGSTGVPTAPSLRHYQNFDDPSMTRQASNRNCPYRKKKDKKHRPDLMGPLDPDDHE